MKLLKTYPHFSDEELQKILKEQKIPRAFSDWQIIYSVQTNYGKQAKEFASILGVKRSKIHHVIQQYNKHGKSWRTHDNWGGRREARCFLTIEQGSRNIKRDRTESSRWPSADIQTCSGFD